MEKSESGRWLGIGRCLMDSGLMGAAAFDGVWLGMAI